MGLKIATNFTRTNRYGVDENLYLTWKKILDLDISVGGTVAFAVFENQAEAIRGNQKDLFKLPITLEQVQQMFNRVGNVALEISDASWEIASATPFIEHWVLNQVSNQYEKQLKSIQDLGGEIIDIGLPNLS